MTRYVRLLALLLVLASLLAACGGATTTTTDTGSTAATATGAGSAGATATGASPAGGATTIILGAYTTPREAYGKLIPIFKAQWKQQTGQDLTFQESYQGSGAQSRAIVEGFEADVAALSLEDDISRIVKAGLITHDWKAGTYKGMVSDSVVAFAVRKGNPKGIKDWADLAKPGVQVLTPNPKTSGGAMWNILALYGAAKRGFVEGVAKDDDAAASEFLKGVLKNVTVMDKGARESITNFEKGIGDVAITYENEVLVGRQNGQDYELVIPRSSILIENPIAVVDTYADKHGSRKAAEAFVSFLLTKEAQEVFAQYGLRSVDPEVAKATAAQYPALEDLFPIGALGGWSEATPKFFGDDGIFTKAVAEVQQ
ncbi:MAG: sulfate ABC transporter substrate-binding protein [Kouleothrix sp.]|nr:sulfate ABC transporter substrate-binding protein [Kouleothrix sp.]